MAGINKVILVGRLGIDPESKTRRDGAQFCSFRMATSKKVKDEERTTWHSVTVWNENTARYLCDFAQKGTLVYIEGEIETRKYDKDGVEHWATDIVVGQYGGNAFICSDGVPRGDGERGVAATPRRPGIKKKTYATEKVQPEPEYEDNSDLDDEIPF